MKYRAALYRHGLSPKQAKVAIMAMRGKTSKKMAEELSVTVSAIKWHLNNIYKALEIEAPGGSYTEARTILRKKIVSL